LKILTAQKGKVFKNLTSSLVNQKDDWDITADFTKIFGKKKKINKNLILYRLDQCGINNKTIASE
jgi:hypothetical protein